MEIKIVVDTNLLVSALIGKSYPHKIVYECVFGSKVAVCLSSAIFNEYKSVLNRPKFDSVPNFRTNAAKMLANFEEIAEFQEPNVKLDVITDESDNRFLELAVTARVNFIISGNTKHFNFPEYKGIQIVIPKLFYEKYCK